MTKPTYWHVCPAKTQISLGIRPVWSASSLCARWVAKDPNFLHADSEVSDQTGRMPRLIWVFAGRTCHFVGFVTRRLNFSLQKMYRKNPKNSDTRKYCFNHPKSWTRWLYFRVMHPKDTEGIAKSVPPDQTAPRSLIWVCTVCPGLCVQNQGSLRYVILIRMPWLVKYEKLSLNYHMSHLMTKPTKWHVRPVKTQISLGICPVWTESSLSAWRKLGSLATLCAHSEDSDQTGRSLRWAHMPLCWFCHEEVHIEWVNTTSIQKNFSLTLSAPYLYENAIPKAKYIFGKTQTLGEKHAKMIRNDE